MKKLLISLSFLLLVSSPVYALIETRNVDRDNFDYEVAFGYSTADMGRGLVAAEVSVDTVNTSNYYYVVPRDGRVVGMSVAGSAACTAGAATFDITINSTVTGVRTIIEPTVVTARSAVGISGSAGPQFAYIRQDRTETVVSKGFNVEGIWTSSRHNAEHPYGKATALTAGNRVGVKVTVSSGFTPNTSTDYVIVIYVLE